MANEQVNLKIHIHQRAETILKAVAQTEAQNKRNVVNNVVSEAVEAVEAVSKNFKLKKTNKQKSPHRLVNSKINLRPSLKTPNSSRKRPSRALFSESETRE